MELKKHLSKDIDNNETLFSIASGPVIIKDNKVLLDKHGNDNFWKFPGGRMHDSESPIETVKREAREELGIRINIISTPFIINFTRNIDEKTEYVVLFHYLAELEVKKINPDRDVRQWDWVDIDNLPEDIAPNIKPAIDYFRK